MWWLTAPKDRATRLRPLPLLLLVRLRLRRPLIRHLPSQPLPEVCLPKKSPSLLRSVPKRCVGLRLIRMHLSPKGFALKPGVLPGSLGPTGIVLRGNGVDLGNRAIALKGIDPRGIVLRGSGADLDLRVDLVVDPDLMEIGPPISGGLGLPNRATGPRVVLPDRTVIVLNGAVQGLVVLLVRAVALVMDLGPAVQVMALDRAVVQVMVLDLVALAMVPDQVVLVLVPVVGPAPRLQLI